MGRPLGVSSVESTGLGAALARAGDDSFGSVALTTMASESGRLVAAPYVRKVCQGQSPRCRSRAATSRSAPGSPSAQSGPFVVTRTPCARCAPARTARPNWRGIRFTMSVGLYTLSVETDGATSGIACLRPALRTAFQATRLDVETARTVETDALGVETSNAMP